MRRSFLTGLLQLALAASLLLTAAPGRAADQVPSQAAPQATRATTQSVFPPLTASTVTGSSFEQAAGFASATPLYSLLHYPPHRPSTRPIIVMVPGIGFRARLFDLSPAVSLTRRLVDRGYDVWQLEPDWSALSQASVTGSTIAHMVDAVLPAAILEVHSAIPDRPIVLLAHGTGGSLVAGYLEAAPDSSIGGAILIAPVLSIRWPDRIWREAATRSLSGETPIDPEELLSTASPFSRDDDLFALLLTTRDGTDKASLYTLVRPALAPVPARVARELQGWIAHGCCNAGTRDYFRELPRLRVPVLLLTGIADNVAHPEDVSHAATHIGSSDREYRMLSRTNFYHRDYGHLDLIATADALRDVYPRILNWLNGHRSGPPIPPADDCLE